MTETSARVICDSVSWGGVRVTTMEVVFHRFVLAEMNTHRVFSRNSASSRAIPVNKMLQRFYDDPADPISWPAEARGMQGGAELEGEDLRDAQELWSGIEGIIYNRIYSYVQSHEPERRLHKSLLNRWLEPAMWHTAIITSTEWENFFNQRLQLREDGTPMAQPEMAAAAVAMMSALDGSDPERLDYGQWHLPYIEFPRDEDVKYPAKNLPKVSAARCARVSYLTQNGVRDVSEDLRLYHQLVKDQHLSPLEHPCTPAHLLDKVPGNFRGWHQLRHLVDEIGV